MGNKALGIIPARGGSKGVQRKNIHPLCGKPLIFWTIEAAQKCGAIDRLIVSTDDAEIAKVSKEYKADVPFLRPAELSQDDTPDLPVCQHALRWMAEHRNYHPDIVVWLRPTCPLRRAQDIKAAIDKLDESGADCVRSVSLVKHHPYWMKRLEQDRLQPFLEGIDETTYYQRQLLPDVYRLNGAVDIIRAENVLKYGKMFYGDMGAYIMPPELSLDIDSETDFLLAEVIINKQENDKTS